MKYQFGRVEIIKSNTVWEVEKLVMKEYTVVFH